MKSILDIIGERYKGVEELISEDCIIPAGTKLEIYLDFNSQTSKDEEYLDEFNLFMLVDKDITYNKLVLSNIFDGYKTSNDDIKIDVIIDGKDIFKRDEEYIFEAISKYL